jgi:tripartite-type tricarboxylate transporter receptor subunit TctC
VPAKTVKELVALAQSKPGSLNYVSGGNGSAAHLATEYFKLMTKTDKLNAAIVKALHSPEVHGLLSGEAAEPVGNSPDEFAKFIKTEIARWAPVVKASGAKPN